MGGLAFLVTSVLSGFSVGLLGMGWTLAIASGLTVVALVHLLMLRVPEDEPERAAGPRSQPRVEDGRDREREQREEPAEEMVAGRGAGLGLKEAVVRHVDPHDGDGGAEGGDASEAFHLETDAAQVAADEFAQQRVVVDEMDGGGHGEGILAWGIRL